MKKTAAILLLCGMLFNITGYHLTVQWMQQQQSSTLDKQLDAANYEEASLIEIMVPLSLPYYNNWSDWERYEGEIQLNGQTYKYVKRKVEGGQLVLKCLPNPQQQFIQKDVSNAFAQLNGLSISEKGGTKSIKQAVNASSIEYDEITLFHLQNVVYSVSGIPVLFSPGSPVKTLLLPSWHPPEFIS